MKHVKGLQRPFQDYLPFVCVCVCVRTRARARVCVLPITVIQALFSGFSFAKYMDTVQRCGLHHNGFHDTLQ